MAYDREHPFFERFKALFRLFKTRPEIIDLNEEAGEAGIFVANHSAASGPFTYELFFPRRVVPWGTHEMCGDYRERWNYLYHVFYQQKLGYCKAAAFLIATPFAVISKLLYNGAELIPTYRDLRLKITIRRSLDALRRGRNILIFPENSSDGYHETLREFNGGFVTLAKRFRTETGRDVPIYTVYYSDKRNRMVIDKPMFLKRIEQELGGGDNKRIAAFFLRRINELNRKYVIG